MSTKTLFLAWQDKKDEIRQWYPMGRLDVTPPLYRFRYIGGAERARKATGFLPLSLDFPDMDKDYRSPELFPLFRNRVIAQGRPDRMDYLRNLDLPENATPVEILSVNGGTRVTDTYEVFPKIEKGVDGEFTCRFFLHGWRHVSPSAQKRLDRLKPQEKLYVSLELANPVAGLAVQIQTTDYHMIGWTPRYLVGDLVKALAEGGGDYGAQVVRVNHPPEPSSQRVLIEMQGHWKEHEPMSGEDFRPLVD
ncbi:MAG: hypothetical protein OXR07_05315 [Nitrospira sp.]|nr:hypothetical protein [Nitrospira sp.]